MKNAYLKKCLLAFLMITSHIMIIPNNAWAQEKPKSEKEEDKEEKKKSIEELTKDHKKLRAFSPFIKIAKQEASN